jgi:hypothetical protein
VLQNPYLSEFLDIYMKAGAPVDSQTVDVRADGQLISMTLIDDAANLWKGDYELTGTGSVVIEACATNLVGSASCAQTTISAQSVVVGDRIRISRGPVEIVSEPGSIQGDGFVLLAPAATQVSDEPDPGGSREIDAFSVGPSTIIGNAILNVVYQLDQVIAQGVTPSHAYLERDGKRLPAVYDPDAVELRVTVTGGGEFVLIVGNAEVTPVADPGFASLEQNYPNPFNPATTIRFELQVGQNVSLRVFDVRGKLVKTLVAGQMPAGVSSVGWNGTGDSGESVASGVYFARLETRHNVLTRKMVLLK